MACVWLAHDLHLDVPRALKVLVTGDPDLHQRFLAEARIASRLHHERLVPVFAVIDEDEIAAMVMEYVDGPSLAELIELRTPLPVAEIDAIADALLQGVELVHRARFVHRDLKPANVLFAKRGAGLELKLTDFGIAKSLDTGDRTRGVVVGTPRFMAPEQWAGQVVDERADLFALGCLLYEIATGARAFPQTDLAEIRDASAAGRMLPVGEARRDLPDRIRNAIQWALAAEPARRPPSVEALRRAWGAPPEPAPIPWSHADEARWAERRAQTRAPEAAVPAAAEGGGRSAVVGRGAEVRAVRDHLTNGARLVTLTGPPGSGKSALAAEIARDWHLVMGAEVVRCDLAELEEAGLERVLDHAAPSDAGDGLDDEPRLLVLEHCDRWVDHVAAWLARRLRAAPEIAVLATSRQRIGVADERVIDVGPLAAPAARELFLAIARRARPGASPDPALVDRIVQDLDRIPLAIVLVASCVRSIAVHDLRARLDAVLQRAAGPRDGTRHQRSFAASFAWSWDLLGASEQQALAQCTVFHGRFGLDAAERVVALAPPDDVWGVLSSLVERSLLQFDGERYWLLATIRRLASERLAPDARAAAEERHQAYYLRTEIRWADWPDQLAATRRAAISADVDTAISAGRRLARLLSEGVPVTASGPRGSTP